MMSALECLAKAEQCEQLARKVLDPSDRGMLRDAAQMWRTLARAAKGERDGPIVDEPDS